MLEQRQKPKQSTYVRRRWSHSRVRGQTVREHEYDCRRRRRRGAPGARRAKYKAWQRTTASVPGANMIALTFRMRRKSDEESSDRRDATPATGGTEEYVDILQVQQLLLQDGTRCTGGGGGGGRDGREPPPQQDYSTRARLLDAATAYAAPSYYYGTPGYGQSTGTVDDLVALWFAGGSSTAAGVFLYFYRIHIYIKRISTVSRMQTPPFVYILKFLSPFFLNY